MSKEATKTKRTEETTPEEENKVWKFIKDHKYQILTGVLITIGTIVAVDVIKTLNDGEDDDDLLLDTDGVKLVPNNYNPPVIDVDNGRTDISVDRHMGVDDVSPWLHEHFDDIKDFDYLIVERIGDDIDKDIHLIGE